MSIFAERKLKTKLKRLYPLVFAAALLLAEGASCSHQHLIIDNPDSPDTPVTPENYKPVMGTFSEINTTSKEISGICLAPKGDGFLGASDENGINHITWNGTTTDFYTGHFDCEGVTIDPKTKDVYYIVENKQEVHRLVAPDYKKDELICIISDVGLGTNNGLEGITWYKDRTLLIGNQKKPVVLIRYSLDKGEISRRDLSSTSLKEIADLCYDPVRDVLWIADSKNRTINLCNLNGDVIQSYGVPFIDNGEGLYVDHAHSCIWVSDDTTSKIYKISFTNL